MWDVLLDLLLGSRCVGCARPGRVLCRGCEAALPVMAAVAWPTPCPGGLALPMAAGEYAEVLKRLVNAHKEERVLALARPLGAALAEVVGELTDAVGAEGRLVVLVPVPSRSAVVRHRGHDPVLRMTRRAASLLRRRGRPAAVARLLRPARTVADQAGLGAMQRAANLAGALKAPTAGSRAPATVVVDDVLTTGATAREAQRALESAGWTVLGIAVVAATRRRGWSGTGGSLPLSEPGG